METALVVLLVLLAITCVISLFRIESERSPHRVKPREGETTAMPAQARPLPPRR